MSIRAEIMIDYLYYGITEKGRRRHVAIKEKAKTKLLWKRPRLQKTRIVSEKNIEINVGINNR